MDGTQVRSDIFAMISQSHELNDLLDMASKEMRSPSYFSNLAIVAVAFSSDFPRDDIESRRLYKENYDNYTFYQEVVVVMEQYKDSTPFIITPSGFRRRLVSKVFYLGQHIGQLCIVEDKVALEQIDPNLVCIFSDAIAISYVMKNGHLEMGQQRPDGNALFKSLLQGRFRKNYDGFVKYMGIIGMRLYPYYQVGCIDCEASRVRGMRHALGQTAFRFGYAMYSVIYHDRVTVMIGMNDTKVDKRTCKDNCVNSPS
jgi:hypothetical protein